LPEETVGLIVMTSDKQKQLHYSLQLRKSPKDIWEKNVNG